MIKELISDKPVPQKHKEVQLWNEEGLIIYR